MWRSEHCLIIWMLWCWPLMRSVMAGNFLQFFK
jgi:hypothetical protein